MQQNLRRFVITTFLFSILDVSLIDSFIVPMLQDYGLLPITLSIVIIVRKASRIIFDIPMGIIADRYGAKIVFLFARIARIVACILLLFKSKICICIGMVSYGISYTGFYGKIDAYIYNYLKINNNLRMFRRIMSMYYGIIQIALILTITGAWYILKYYDFRILTYATIFTTLLSFIIWPSLATIVCNNNKESNIFRIAIQAFKNMNFKKNVRITIMLLALSNAITWQSGTIIQQGLLGTGMDKKMLGIMYGLQSICMTVGSIISFFISRYIVKIPHAMFIFLISTIFMTISGAIFSSIAITLWIIFNSLIYSSVQVSIERLLDSIVSNESRISITSCSTFLASCISVVFMFIFGIISEYVSVRVSFVTIGLIAVLITTYLFSRLRYFRNPDPSIVSIKSRY